MSFRGRIVGGVSAVTTLTLGGACLGVYLIANAAQLDRLDDALRTVAAEEAAALATQTADPPVLKGSTRVRTYDAVPLPRWAALYESAGRVVATTPAFPAPPPFGALPPASEPFVDFWSGRDHLRGIVVDVPARRLTLLVATSRAEVDGDAAFLARSMAVVFLAAVAWAALVTYWLAGRFSKDHRAIAAVARRVAAGDLAARVSIRSPDRQVAQLGRDIDEMIERLGLLVSSQQRFVAHAAHELRSPLTTLYGELSHALRKERDAASYRQTIEEALDSTRKLKALTEDLLALARMLAPQGEPAERASCADLVHAAAGAVAGEAAAKRVAVEIDAEDALVSGHPRDLERMVRNVLENAVRHSPAAGTTRVRIRRAGGAVEILVSDDGPGVPDAQRERIFEPFFRGESERSLDLSGAGLGLPMAREIARAHGGDIQLLSGPGEGARFGIRLPVTDAAPSPASDAPRT
jgi:two-component system heavy metal sensor histidine kinase CusS